MNPQDPGNLVLGRANPARIEIDTLRLMMLARSATTEQGAEQEGKQEESNETRDAVLLFRKGMDRALDRVLRDLARGRAVGDDPEWRVFVNGLVRLLVTDDWDGLERATREVQRVVVAKKAAQATKVKNVAERNYWESVF